MSPALAQAGTVRHPGAPESGGRGRRGLARRGGNEIRLVLQAGLLCWILLWQGCGGPSGLRRSVAVAADARERDSEEDLERRAKAHAAFAKGLLHEMNKEGDEALRSFTESVLHDPGHDELVLEVAQRHMQAKKPLKAVEVLEKAVAIPNPPAVFFALLSSAQLEAGQLSKAIAIGKKAVQLAPDNPLAHRSLFQAYLRDKQFAAAMKSVESAARHPSTNDAYWIGIAELAAGLQSVQGADQDKARALTLELLGKCKTPESQANPLELQRMAELYEASRQYARAETLYLELLKRFPSVSALKSRLLGLYLKSGDRGRAIEQLELLARASPTNPNVQYLLGNLLGEDKKFEPAIEAYRRAIQLKPDFEEAYFDLASLLMSQKQVDKAVDLLESARKKLKNRFAIEFYLAMARSSQKLYDEALKHLVEAEVLAKVDDPTRLNHIFYFQLGAMHERRKDFAAAEKAMLKSIELSPKFAEALNYLGYMWADRGERLKEAKAMIERALDEEPKNGAFLDSMAWVLFKMNKPQEALAWMQKSIANVTEPDATLYDHLGDIYQSLNEPAKAREAWIKSLSIEENEAIRKKVTEHPAPRGPRGDRP